MKKLELMSFILLALLMSILLFCLAINKVTYFSLAMLGYPNWGFVVLNIILLCLFILFIQFRRKAARLPSSVYLAFIVALFLEMYGFPLTMYIISWSVGYSNPGNLWYLLTSVVGENLFASILSVFLLPISNIIILIGILLIIFGWRKIFRAKGQLVTTGIYRYIRHPQYLGFLLIILGMNVLWVTLSTLLLWPILIVLYYRLAKEEDKELEERFGEEYQKYKRMVPMLIPRRHRTRT